jgi:hypothetical protein
MNTYANKICLKGQYNKLGAGAIKSINGLFRMVYYPFERGRDQNYQNGSNKPWYENIRSGRD